jgi:hypothetical protein
LVAGPGLTLGAQPTEEVEELGVIVTVGYTGWDSSTLGTVVTMVARCDEGVVIVCGDTRDEEAGRELWNAAVKINISTITINLQFHHCRKFGMMLLFEEFKLVSTEFWVKSSPKSSVF